MQTISRAFIGIVAALLAIGLVIFGVQNTEPVKITFLNFSTEQISISLLVIGAFILGAIMMWLIGLIGAAQRGIRQMAASRERASLMARNRELETRIAGLEKELGTFKPATAPEPKAAPSKTASKG
jgi:putative membrane protein